MSVFPQVNLLLTVILKYLPKKTICNVMSLGMHFIIEWVAQVGNWMIHWKKWFLCILKSLIYHSPKKKKTKKTKKNLHEFHKQILFYFLYFSFGNIDTERNEVTFSYHYMELLEHDFVSEWSQVDSMGLSSPEKAVACSTVIPGPFWHAVKEPHIIGHMESISAGILTLLCAFPLLVLPPGSPLSPKNLWVCPCFPF
jgi:hypothetical protein